MDFEAVAEGFHLEGMCPDGEALWFSDAFEGGLRRRSADGRIQVWLPERQAIGGVLLNADGKALCSGIGGIAWVDAVTGASGVLLDAIDGEPVPGVNEMIPDGDGGLYFGLLDLPAHFQGRQMPPSSIHRLEASGRVSLVCGDVVFPNGMGLSPDGRRLYWSDTGVGAFAYDLADAGSGRAPTRLIEKTDCDGLALDAEGCVWVTGFQSKEILRLAPDGAVRGRIAIPPADGVTNVRFAGADSRDLYVSTSSFAVLGEYQAGKGLKTRGSRIYRTRAEMAGLPIPPTRFSLG